MSDEGTSNSAPMERERKNRYNQLLEDIFASRYQPGDSQVDFARVDLETTAAKLNITLPKNLGDVLYGPRYRSGIPPAIADTAPEGKMWIILSRGRSLYRFVLFSDQPIAPNAHLSTVKIPDSTPGLFARYATNDEQALLVKVRYNRLIDIFTGVTCYSLQNHLRTTVPDMGQVETDEIYIGIDRRGLHYVFPVQAKGGKDNQNVVQIMQDAALCRHKFPDAVCKPIGIQFMRNRVIAMFAFQVTADAVNIEAERHYELVAPEQVTASDLETYRQSLPLE
jgi:hypothetical protein